MTFGGQEANMLQSRSTEYSIGASIGLDGPHERVYAILKAFDTTYIVRHIHTNMSEKRFPIPPES